MIDEFEHQGYIIIRNAIGSAHCNIMCESIWSALEKKHGILKDDQATWTIAEPRGLGFLRTSGVFDDAATPSVLHAVNTLIGHDSWDYPEHWGGTLVTFPSAGPWQVPSKGWHIDYPARGNLKRRFAVKMLALLSDMKPGGGATLLAPGSHLRVRELTQKFPDGNAGSSSEVKAIMTGKGVEFGSGCVEFTGAAGDVLLFDPWLFHNASKNVNSTPRMMVEQNIPTRAALSLYTP